MPTIIYKTDKKTGNVFAYRSTSYRDPVTKRPRSRQEYLGRVDPVTGDILPKGTDGKRNRSSSTKQLNEVENKVQDLEKEVEASKKQINYLQTRVDANNQFFNIIREAVHQQEEKLSFLDSSNPSIMHEEKA